MKTVALELQPCCAVRSGIGTYAYELAKRLRGDETLRYRGNLFNFLHRNDNRAALEGISMPICVNRLLAYGIYRRIWNFVPIPYDLLFHEPADLTIFFNYIVPPHIKGYVMTTVYDMTYLRLPETMEARNRIRLRRGMERSVRRADRILTISDFSKREIEELLEVPEERISVIPCAPDYSEQVEPFDTLARKYGLRKPYLLYVGTIEPRKNLVRLLRAYESLRRREALPYQLVLAGGRGWRTEEFDRVYTKSPAREQIILTGYVSAAEKNSLYQNAALFVFPSLYEGFGIPPLEAMHWGCPVVCADCASLPEVVGDAAVLVDPMEEESIAQGIWRVLSDEALARELVRRGAERAIHYTWEDSARGLEAVCRELLN